MPSVRKEAGEHLLRELAPQVLTAIVRRFGAFDAAEDAVQEALIAAAAQWPADGLPDDPRAWLIRVAARRFVDHTRAEAARRRREENTAPWEPGGEPSDMEVSTGRDDALALLFMCCHPALTPSSAIALTLRAVGGLTTAEIARAFLVPEATMAQRISRAKQTIRASEVPFEPPSPEERPGRLGTVLQVLHLLFNEGYVTSFGPALEDRELASEAIRICRMLHGLAPDTPEVAGLLALMLLTHARRAARMGKAGELVPLDEQDRSVWDRVAIFEGQELLARTLPQGRVGPFQVQAAIAALHDEAPRFEDTDWPQILALYEVLRKMEDNPVIELNHAVAVAMVHGPRAGLERLDGLASSPRLVASHRLHAVRAHLLERAGDLHAAREQYRRAAEAATNLAERNYLLDKSARLEKQRPTGPGRSHT